LPCILDDLVFIYLNEQLINLADSFWFQKPISTKPETATNETNTMKKLPFFILTLILFTNINSQSIGGAEIKIDRKTFVYKTVGNIPIKADLLQISNDSLLKPAIIWIHGGGLIFGSRADLPDEQVKLYLTAGYSLVSIDYRLSPETKLDGIVNDITDAIKWVRLNGADLLRIDSTKIFVIGHSGGAYLALMSGYFLENPPNAIVSFYGYGDIQSDWYNKPDSFSRTKTLIRKEEAKKLIYDSVITSASFDDRFNLYLFSRQNGLWPSLVSGHSLIKERTWFDIYCPIKNIKANYPPVLLIHGDKDTDVPFEQSVLMDKELQSKKIKHKFIRVENHGHVFDLFEGGLSNPDISKVFNEVLDFLNIYR
jgi:acetyl esterase/lipase